MKNTLVVINGSHPCVTVQKALELKGIEYRTVEVLPGVQPLLKPFFGGRTVPALRFSDGTKVQGSRAILAELDKRQPEPPLYGSPEILEAERWGDEHYQGTPRAILWPALAGHGEVLHAFQAGSKLPALPMPAVKAMAPGILAIERKLNATNDDVAKATIATLPDLLDHVDGLIADGVLGGSEPNAADLQIAPTTRLLHSVADLRPLIAGRPAESHAFQYLEPAQAEVPAGIIDPSWLAGVRTSDASAAAAPANA